MQNDCSLLPAPPTPLSHNSSSNQFANKNTTTETKCPEEWNQQSVSRQTECDVTQCYTNRRIPAQVLAPRDGLVIRILFVKIHADSRARFESRNWSSRGGSASGRNAKEAKGAKGEGRGEDRGRSSCAKGGHKSTPSFFDLLRLAGGSTDNIEFSPCFLELAHLNEDLGSIKVELIRSMVTWPDKL